MLNLPSRLFVSAICLGVGIMPASAQTAKYVLDLARGVNVAPLAAQYGFTVLRSWTEDAEIDYSILTPNPLSTATLKQLGAEKGVLAISAELTIHSSESDPSSKVSRQLEPLSPIVDHSVVDFYGNRVLSIYVNQPGTKLIQSNTALAKMNGGAGVVAIIDTGVDVNHPALQGSLVPGFDFTRDQAGTVSELYDLAPQAAGVLQQSTVEFLDSKQFVPVLTQSTVEFLDQSTVEFLDGMKMPAAFGHGTMIAGLVHLVAPHAKIMPLKAFLSDGSASLYDIARAIRYAADHNADVISMSFSYPADSPLLKDAITYAQSRGALCISSAGNSGANTMVYPASYPQVVGVGSTNFSDRRSPFSNFGHAARTSAPGEALITLFPGGNYAAVWGTSFSTALVSGATSMMRFYWPKMHFDSLQDALEHGVEVDLNMGDARLDVLKSLLYCSRPGR